MTIRVCVAGVTGWTGSLVAKAIEKSDEFTLVGAVARSAAGKELKSIEGFADSNLKIAKTIAELDHKNIDVMIDYTKPDSVLDRTKYALEHGIRVVVGTSGLSASQFQTIEALALKKNLGVIAAGNFSITAALAKHFSLLAAKHLPTWEIIDYAHAGKVDAPSGTTRELAEMMSLVAKNKIKHPVSETMGHVDARGADIAGTQVHSVRLPSYTIAFETIFGLPDERLTIRHDAGTGAEPYVAGTLLAVKKVMAIKGLVRGLDQLLFS